MSEENSSKNCPFCGAKPFINKFGVDCVSHKFDCYFAIIYANPSVQIGDYKKWNKRS